MKRKRRIGIDARMVEQTQTGLGRYASALAAHVPPLDPESEFVVILRPDVDERLALPSPQANVEIARIDGWLDTPGNLLCARQIDRLGLDLYHSLHHFLPLGLSCRRVVFTLHDLIWVEHPQLTFDRWDAPVRWRAIGLWGRATMSHAVRRADHIVAISQHSAERVIDRYEVDPRQVTVIHHGIDHRLFETASRSGRSEQSDSAAPYFLSLGNTKPYKNVRNALRAFALLSRRHPELKLVVTGRSDSRASLAQLAAKLGVRERVEFTGMVDQAKLNALLAGAQALVFPSFIEGFGFPLVEAMSAGCPVVSSRIPVIEEIVGDAALLADPHDPVDIAAAMEKVLTDSTLRDRLRELGQQRCQQFQWNKAAAETLAVYQRLLSG